MEEAARARSNTIKRNSINLLETILVGYNIDELKNKVKDKKLLRMVEGGKNKYKLLEYIRDKYLDNIEMSHSINKYIEKINMEKLRKILNYLC